MRRDRRVAVAVAVEIRREKWREERCREYISRVFSCPAGLLYHRIPRARQGYVDTSGMITKIRRITTWKRNEQDLRSKFEKRHHKLRRYVRNDDKRVVTCDSVFPIFLLACCER